MFSQAFKYQLPATPASIVVLLLWSAPAAQAEIVMSCDDFRTALWRAIDHEGNMIARPQLEKRTANGFGPLTGYEMTEIDGLVGRLNCLKDQVFSFSATTRSSSDQNEVTLRINRLKNLAAAAICALSSPQPALAECASLADAILGGATDEYAKARVRGESRGYAVGARLHGGSKIEMQAEETSLTFFLSAF